MANITLPQSTTWAETLLHWFDARLDVVERAVRSCFADGHADFNQAAHIARVRRLAAHGCSGQSLI